MERYAPARSSVELSMVGMVASQASPVGETGETIVGTGLAGFD